MKNTTLTVAFPTERLDALMYHLERKEVSLQDELNDTIQKLYEKHVPQTTRDYIEDKIQRDVAARERPRRPTRREEQAGNGMDSVSGG